ncbi:MAG TPA: site-2 protease family protein [Candidatus Paceibacterota bacterium]
MNIIFQIVILILSATLHEASHGYVAYALGDPTAKLQGRLTLNPLRHLDPFGSVILPMLMYLASSGTFIFGWAKPVPYNPYNLRGGKWGPLWVALAGPLSNLLLAIVFGFIVRFGGAGLPPSFVFFASIIVAINVLLAVFNLLPIPPLDGSKVLFALLPSRARFIEELFTKYQMFILLFLLFFGWPVIEYPVIWLSRLLLGS